MILTTPLRDLLIATGGVPTVPYALARVNDFENSTQAHIVGALMCQEGWENIDEALTEYWDDYSRNRALIKASSYQREVIIGGGYHAAVYAAERYAKGFPMPLVLERSARPGGTFAMTKAPTFHLNSRNRAGRLGAAGDSRAALNYLPGAIVQPSMLDTATYQSNADMAMVIRLALRQYTNVVTCANVASVTRNEEGWDLILEGGESVKAGRIIDARGLGDSVVADVADETRLLTFQQFMERMEQPWPFRGKSRIAVIGGGDSGKCVVEALMGVGPTPQLANLAMDRIEQVDWYGPELESFPITCNEWESQVPARYRAIGRFLRPDQTGYRRLIRIGRRGSPTIVGDGVLVQGTMYDMAVACIGNRLPEIPGLSTYLRPVFSTAGAVARQGQDENREYFRIGPCANLEWSNVEFDQGLPAIENNRVAMFRLAWRTMALAGMLKSPGVPPVASGLGELDDDF